MVDESLPAELTDRWREQTEAGVDRKTEVLRAIREKREFPRDLRGIPLAKEKLSGCNFSHCDLSGADLTNADLSEANFFRSILRGTHFPKTDLRKCEFLGADLTGANLDECNAVRASFGRADLTGAILLQGNLEGATFSQSTLKDADLRIANLKGAKFQQADLTGADLTRANLQEADLSECTVKNTSFVYADLRHSRLKRIHHFKKARWIGADIREMDLYGAYLLRRHVMDENYLHEFRTQNRLNGILYYLWWATSDCGRSFLRWALCTAAVVVFFAFLYGLVGLNYGTHPPTPFTCFYYSVVTLTTLGYGDIIPASTLGRILVIIEVALGYLTLGGLISILANKMARRAD